MPTSFEFIWTSKRSENGLSRNDDTCTTWSVPAILDNHIFSITSTIVVGSEGNYPNKKKTADTALAASEIVRIAPIRVLGKKNFGRCRHGMHLSTLKTDDSESCGPWTKGSLGILLKQSDRMCHSNKDLVLDLKVERTDQKLVEEMTNQSIFTKQQLPSLILRA